MEKLIGKPLKKKEFCVVWNLDHTLSKDKLRTELKKADQFCKWHIEGKGAGTRYIIDEVYETPIELVHGNTGNTPWNKDKFDENSLKYKLAEALILNFSCEDNLRAPMEAKSHYLKMLDGHLHNFKHVEEMFNDKNFEKVEYIAKKVANNNSKALNNTFNEAIRLIGKGAFPGIQLEEQLWYATFDYEHLEFYGDIEDLHDLYLEARAEAKTNVEAIHGPIGFFSEKRHLINYEYRDLIESEDKYQALYDNEIDYIYNRYAFIGKYQKHEIAEPYDYENFNYDGSNEIDEDADGEWAAEQFIEAFQEHRNIKSVEQVNKEIEKGIAGIVDLDELQQFAEDFTMMLFDNCDYETFAKRFNELMENVRRIKNTGFELTN